MNSILLQMQPATVNQVFEDRYPTYKKYRGFDQDNMASGDKVRDSFHIFLVCWNPL